MNPEYVKIDDKKYKINTDYRVALKCDSISKDDNITTYEKVLAIIYLLFGDEGLEDKLNYDRLFELAIKYLNCGEELETTNDEIDMDLEQDFNLIRASFKKDYNIDLPNENMHYYDFCMYLNGLSEECILNRIRSLRTYDVRKIEDRKERNRIIKAQKHFELKKLKRENHLTKEQEQSMKELNELLGL